VPVTGEEAAVIVYEDNPVPGSVGQAGVSERRWQPPPEQRDVRRTPGAPLGSPGQDEREHRGPQASLLEAIDEVLPRRSRARGQGALL